MLSVYVSLADHQMINIGLIYIHIRSGLALESLITILTTRFIPFFMILLIIGMDSIFLLRAQFSYCLFFLIQQMLPCVFTQSTCCLKYFVTAMPLLSITSLNPYERSYSERGIDVSRPFFFFFMKTTIFLPWLMLIFDYFSGKELCHSYFMGGHLLYNAHVFPVVRKKKRRRCGEGT
jgi:hypothetical protein